MRASTPDVQAPLDAWSVLQNVGVWLGVRGARQRDRYAPALGAAAEREGVWCKYLLAGSTIHQFSLAV